MSDTFTVTCCTVVLGLGEDCSLVLFYLFELEEGEGLNNMVHRSFCLYVINNFENLT